MTVADSRDLKRRTCRSQLLRGAIWLVAAFLAAGGTSPAADASAKASRLTVAVLTFEDQTADPEAAHWRARIADLSVAVAVVNHFSVGGARGGWRKFLWRVLS
jgi:hypothetical protein